jgi:hypothetical protein
MDNEREVSCPLVPHFKLSKRAMLLHWKMKKEKQHVPYALAVWILMYTLLCTWPNIAQVVSIVSIFLSNLGRLHWEHMKLILRYLQGNTNLKLCFGGSAQVDCIFRFRLGWRCQW